MNAEASVKTSFNFAAGDIIGMSVYCSNPWTVSPAQLQDDKI